MAIATNLGYPRIGAERELKWALERFWRGDSGPEELEETARTLRRTHWELQRSIGLGHVPSNDFSLYDHVLDTAVMVGAVPERYQRPGASSLETYFAMARGRLGGHGVAPLELTKWFDTNYHHLVPELAADQEFGLKSSKPVAHFREAAAAGVATRPVLLGPVSFLLLTRAHGGSFRPLDLLSGLLDVYAHVLAELAAEGAEWVQLDEPCLAGDIGGDAHVAYVIAYHRLARAANLQLLVATYFSGLRANLATALRLPVAALHLDLVREPEQLAPVLDAVPASLSLSLGVVDGRNVWRTDLDAALRLLEAAAARIGPERVLVAPSCSLMHVPIDLDLETGLDPQLRRWLAFSVQKLREVVVLTRGLDEGRDAVADELADARDALAERRMSPRVHDPEVARRLERLRPADFRRASPWGERRVVQARVLGLPPLPTTTVGSFPQTNEVRRARAQLRRGELDRRGYEASMWAEVDKAIKTQEQLGLDVLVHGEFERSDMVEHFAERLRGFAVTRHGWVQSYGSRCVRPPLIYGDVVRPGPVTVEWARGAQARTRRPVKAILTGPVTLLRWSFAPDDRPPDETCAQIALAIRDETVDLETAGIRIVQLDEPALREGLPAHAEDVHAYLDWAVGSFRLASCGLRDDTQVHAHVCYADFDDFLDVLQSLDVDVLSVEAARSGMGLLGALNGGWRGGIGPGVHDVHAPGVPPTEEIVERLRRALAVLGPDQLWVNPDCGLKTRRWQEVVPALENMVEAAAIVRAELAGRWPAQPRRASGA